MARREWAVDGVLPSGLSRRPWNAPPWPLTLRPSPPPPPPPHNHSTRTSTSTSTTPTLSPPRSYPTRGEKPCRVTGARLLCHRRDHTLCSRTEVFIRDCDRATDDVDAGKRIERSDCLAVAAVGIARDRCTAGEAINGSFSHSTSIMQPFTPQRETAARKVANRPSNVASSGVAPVQQVRTGQVRSSCAW